MKRVAIYCRKSVFVEGSVSIETQINLCKDYINKKYSNIKFEILEIQIDQHFKKCLNL